MTLNEAIKSGRLFKRKHRIDWLDASSGLIKIYSPTENIWRVTSLTVNDLTANDYELHEPTVFLPYSEIERAWGEVFGMLLDTQTNVKKIKHYDKLQALCYKIGLQTPGGLYVAKR